MPRAVTTNLATLLADPQVITHSTLDLIYSDNSVTQRHWATVDLTYSGTHYTPYVKKIGDIKQSIQAAADRVRVTLINNDNVVCADVASSLQYFNWAEAIVGRHYSSPNTIVEEQRELFRGIVAKPEVTNEREVNFDIVDSLVARGTVIGSRPMTIKCPFRFKDGRTCTYSGVETLCNKMPNSANGCGGRTNTPHFGGWWFPYSHTAASPGTGGDPGGGGGGGTGGGGDGGGGDGGGGACFTGDTLVTMEDGTLKPIRYVRPGDVVLCFRWNEVAKQDVITVRRVTKTHVHEVYDHFRFGFDNGKFINVTSEHPLYVEKGAFRQAGHMTLRHKVSSLDQSRLGTYGLEHSHIRSMLWNNEAYIHDRPVLVYNLSVEDCQTYFANGIAVHNTKPIEVISFN